MKNNFTVGSLYAGVGGICLGFKNAGFNLSWANEVDKHAATTYKANFDHELIEDDVLKIHPDGFYELGDYEMPDVLTAGFPCQPFSIAGNQKGFNDARGNHFFKIMEFIDAGRPKVIFLENVRNLENHDKGRTMKVIQDSILERGYTFDYRIMNTKEYGNLPQNRERIYMICFDKKILGEDFKFNWPDPVKRVTTIKNIVGESKIVDKKYFYRNNDLLEREVIKQNTIYQLRRIYVRENKSGVCPTLTANMGTGGNNVPLIKTDYGIRKLTPRECFKFQGFPKFFVLPEIADCHLYKQAGNSVSVPVVERLALNILTTLKQYL